MKLKFVTFVFAFSVLNITSCMAMDRADCVEKKPDIEERINQLEEFNLEQRTENSELSEKIEMLAELLGFDWRRQINRGTWIKK